MEVTMEILTTDGCRRIIDELRRFASVLERCGPGAYCGGGIAFSLDQDTLATADHNGVMREIPVGHPTITLDSNLSLREGVACPEYGLKPRMPDGRPPVVGWDGKPPRPPKRGEFYSDDGMAVERAKSNRKTPKWIYEVL